MTPPDPAPSAPRREVITGPRRDVRRAPRRRVTAEISQQTPLGNAYLRALVRSQLRLGLATVALVLLPLASLPLLFGLWEPSAQLVIGQVPLWWLLLGGLVYPAVMGVAWWYVRAAERNERQFTDLVERR